MSDARRYALSGVHGTERHRYSDEFNARAVKTGAILADQIKGLDWRVRKAEPMGSAPQEVVEEVLGKVSALVGGYEPPR